jgi:CubicO group peptidase (beta-lactamase class C family)
MGADFTLQARYRVASGGRDEVVLLAAEKRGERLVVLGFDPLGTELFAVVQEDGAAPRRERHLRPLFPFAPENALRDLVEARFPEPVDALGGARADRASRTREGAIVHLARPGCGWNAAVEVVTEAGPSEGAAGAAPFEARAVSVTPGADGAGDLATVLEPIRAEYALPALAGAVLRGGELEVGATGVRKKGSREPATADDLWHLGSCTKAMTATLAARLVERGRIGWDARVADVLPALGERIHPEFRGATLEQLLAHRGGAPGDLLRLPLWSWLRSSRAPSAEARARFVADVLARRPEAAPGARFLYSNAGYTVAGAMLEAAAGEPWETLVRRDLFEPLGMSSAGFGAPGHKGSLDQPWGHAVQGRSVRPVEPGPAADNPAAIAPAGGVHATLADWARFAALHLRAARGDPGFLSPESVRKLHTPQSGDYALGWLSTDAGFAGRRAFGHRGSNTMWVAEVWIVPELDAAFLVATNQGGPRAEEATAYAMRELAHRARATGGGQLDESAPGRRAYGPRVPSSLSKSVRPALAGLGARVADR